VNFGSDIYGQGRVPADLGPVIAGSESLQTKKNFSVAADDVAGKTEFAQSSIIVWQTCVRSSLLQTAANISCDAANVTVRRSTSQLGFHDASWCVGNMQARAERQ